MPYIKQINRDVIGPLDYRQVLVCNVGELNYCITKLIHEFLLKENLRYTSINAVIGVLECAKLELYRQIATPYEDQKKKSNGPVSELDNKGG